jgi:hypothetical protein
MPTDKPEKTPAEPSAPLTALSEAWEQLAVANDALAAALQTGSREYGQVGMRVLRSRIGTFDRAVAALLEESER